MKTILIELALIGFTLSDEVIDTNHIRLPYTPAVESHAEYLNPLRSIKETHAQPQLKRESNLSASKVH
jgi:hypothetical protein